MQKLAQWISDYLALIVLLVAILALSVPSTFTWLLTPFLTWLLAGASVEVNVWDMMLGVTQVVIVPIAIGLFVKAYLDKLVNRIIVYLSAFSTLAVGLIIGIFLSMNAQSVLSSGWLILAVVVLHNLFGFMLGYSVGKDAGMAPKQINAVTIEVGMQNSGLATSLAATNIAAYPLATVPGAIFSVWHNFSGALAESILKKRIKEHFSNGSFRAERSID